MDPHIFHCCLNLFYIQLHLESVSNPSFNQWVASCGLQLCGGKKPFRKRQTLFFSCSVDFADKQMLKTLRTPRFTFYFTSSQKLSLPSPIFSLNSCVFFSGGSFIASCLLLRMLHESYLCLPVLLDSQSIIALFFTRIPIPLSTVLDAWEPLMATLWFDSLFPLSYEHGCLLTSATILHTHARDDLTSKRYFPFVFLCRTQIRLRDHEWYASFMCCLGHGVCFKRLYML